MGDKHLTVAGWKAAKVEAHKDPLFKKGASGIEKQLGKVEKLIKAKMWVEVIPDLKALRDEAAKSLVDASKQQKKKGKDANPATYRDYSKYLTEMVEEVDRTLQTTYRVLETDTTMKRKRQPKDFTLAMMLKNKKLLTIFRAYCKFAKQEPECEFVKDMLVGKNKPSQKIYDRYLKKGSPFEINVDMATADEWHKAAESQDWGSVNPKDAVEAAITMLENNPIKVLREGEDNPRVKLWVDKLCDA